LLPIEDGGEAGQRPCVALHDLALHDRESNNSDKGSENPGAETNRQTDVELERSRRLAGQSRIPMALMQICRSD
jgi:hypothetical protein